MVRWWEMDPHNQTRAAPVPMLGLLVFFLLWGCTQPAGEAGRAPAITLQGMTLRHYAETGPPKVATAERVTFERDRGVVAAEAISVDLPPTEEFSRGAAHLQAERGQGDIHGKGAVVEGPVDATTTAGDRVATVGTVWEGERDVLLGQSPVRARGPGYTLEGDSYSYDASARTLALVGDVRFRSTAEAALDSGDSKAPQPLDVRSPRLTVDAPKRRATFSGGVVLTQGDLVVRCPELVAHTDGGTRIRKVVCSGKVEATHGPRTMEAGAGTFDNESRVLLLEEAPVIREGDRWLRGEKMSWMVDAQIATVEQGVADWPAADVPAEAGKAAGGPLRVTADRITYEARTQTARFLGNVVAKRGEMTLRATHLVAIASGDGGLDRAWTEGGPVSVVEGPRHATSGKAHFTGSGSRLVLSEKPRLVENGSSLEGSRVVFHLGQDRVEVEQPRAVFPLEDGGGAR